MSQAFKKFLSGSDHVPKQNAYVVSNANGTTMLGPLLLKQKTQLNTFDKDRIRHATTTHAITADSDHQTRYQQAETVQVYALVSKETKLLSEISPFIGWDGKTSSTSPGHQWVDRLETVDIRLPEKIMAPTGNSYIQTIKNNRKNSFSVQNVIPLNFMIPAATNSDHKELTLTQPLKFESNANTSSYIEEIGDERSKDATKQLKHKRGEQTTRSPEVDTSSRVSTFLSVTNVRPRVLPPERPPPAVPSPQRPPPVVPPPRSTSLGNKADADEEPDDFVPELLSMKKITNSTPSVKDTDREIGISADHNKHGHTDHGAKQTVNLPVRAVSTSGPHFFTAHNIDIDFKKRISSKLSEPLPGDEEDEDSHKNKRGTNPLKKFFARKKGKYDPSVDSEIFESTLPSSGSDTRHAKKKKKDAPKKKPKDKDNKKAKKPEQTKPRLTKDEIVVVKSSGKCLTDLSFSPDGLELDMSQSPELGKSHKVVNKQSSTSDEGSDGSKSAVAHDEYNEVDDEGGGVYANFPTVLRRKVGSGHRVAPPKVPSTDSSTSDQENEYNEPEDNEDEDKADSSQSQGEESVENDEAAEDEAADGEVVDDEAEEIYVNTLLLAKMNKSDTPSKSPSSVTSDGSSSNSGHQGCYVVNYDEQINEHVGSEMTVTATEDHQTSIDDSTFSKDPSEFTIQPEATEIILTAPSEVKEHEDPSKGLRRFGTLENLNSEGNNSHLVRQTSQEVSIGLQHSNSKLEDNKTLVDNVIKLEDNDKSKEKTDIDDNRHVSITGVEHKQVLLPPSNEAHLLVNPMTMSPRDIAYQSTQKYEIQLDKDVSVQTKQNRLETGLKENKDTEKSVGKNIIVNAPIISGNLKVKQPGLKLEQANTIHLSDEDSNHGQTKLAVKQDLHLDIKNDVNTKRDEKVLAEKGGNSSVQTKDKSDVNNKGNKSDPITSPVAIKIGVTSPGAHITKPPVPPPTKPKPPAWKMKELMSHQEHQQNASPQSAHLAPKAQLTSRGSEESINKKLIAGALKELDDFIDNEIKQDTASKKFNVRTANSPQCSQEDYEKFIVSHKHIGDPEVSKEQSDNSNTAKPNVTIVNENVLGIKPAISVAGSSELGKYERVVSCTIESRDANISPNKDKKHLIVNPSNDRGYEDVINIISAEKSVDHEDMEKIYDEIGDSDSDLSPTSRCFKFHWKRKDRDQSLKKEDGEPMMENVRESKERKNREVKGNKTKEETGEKINKDKKRKKKTSVNAKSKSKKDSRREKSKSHRDGVEGETHTSSVCSSTSGESEYSDYDVMAEIGQDKERDVHINDPELLPVGIDTVGVHDEKKEDSAKIRIVNADSFGYEIPSKLAVSSKISDHVKVSPTKVNDQGVRNDLSDLAQNKSDSLINQTKNDADIGAHTNVAISTPNDQPSLEPIAKESKPTTVELKTLKGTEHAQLNVKLRETTMVKDNFETGSVSVNHGISIQNKSTSEDNSSLHENSQGNVTTHNVIVAREIEEPRHPIHPAIYVQNKLAMFQANTDVDKVKRENKSDKNQKENKTKQKSTRHVSSSSSSSSSSDSIISGRNNIGGEKKRRKKKQIKVSVPEVDLKVKKDGGANFVDTTTPENNKKEIEIKENIFLDEEKEKKKSHESKTKQVDKDIKFIGRKENNIDRNVHTETENSHSNLSHLPKPKIEFQGKDNVKTSMKDSPHVIDLKLHTESDKSQEPAREVKKHHTIPPSSEPIKEIKTNKSNEEKRHNIKTDNAMKPTSPDKMKSNTIEMKDSVFPDRLDAHLSMTPATTDAVSSVFQIPYVQSLSEIDDGPWKDYSALELGGLTKSKEASADNKVISQKQKPPDTADRTTSLPPDHVAPPVPRVRSKIGLVNEAGDVLRLPKKPDVNLNVIQHHSVHAHEESDTEIYADGTSESNNCDDPKGPLTINIPRVSIKHKTDVTDNNNRARDDGEVSSDEREADGQDYDQVPVRMRRLVNAKPVFPGVMTVSSAATSTPGGRTTSGELTHTKRSTKGPHSAGPEYALPWEDKKLDTLAPATTLGSLTPVTASSRSSSEPSSEIDSFSGARMSYTSEDINDEIGFGIGDRHKTKRLDPSSNTKPADKHRVYHQDGKKGNRLKAITSLFHRKKKDKKETDRNDDDSDDDKDDVTDDENVSESKKKKRDSEKSDHKKRKPEKPKKPEKLHKGNKTDRLSSEIDSEGLEMTSPDQTDREPLCRLIKINDDGSKVMEMIRPQSEPLGIFFKKGPETHREGLVVKSFLDKYAKRLFAGLLRVGDEIVEIDDDDICHLTLDEIKELIQQKERMVLKLRATDYLT